MERKHESIDLNQVGFTLTPEIEIDKNEVRAREEKQQVSGQV
jgi:hypothetical protein